MDLCIWRVKPSGGICVFLNIRALVLNPNSTTLMAYAIDWEYSKRKNVSAARSLSLLFIKKCPKELELWKVYLRVEIDFATIVTKRRNLLGLDNDSVENSEKVASCEVTQGSIVAIILEQASNLLNPSDFKNLIGYLSSVNGIELLPLCKSFFANK